MPTCTRTKRAFHSRAARKQYSEPAKPAKADWHMYKEGATMQMTLLKKCFQCKETELQNAFYMCNAVGSSLHGRCWAVSFKPLLLFKCSLCATWAWRKCGFHSSVTCYQVRLSYTTLRHRSTLDPEDDWTSLHVVTNVSCNNILRLSLSDYGLTGSKISLETILRRFKISCAISTNRNDLFWHMKTLNERSAAQPDLKLSE